MFKEKTKKSLGQELCKNILSYLEDEEHRKDFEEWYFEKYGVEYEWKKGVKQCHKEKEEKERLSV